MTHRAIGESGPPLLKPVRLLKGKRPMKRVNPERKAALYERNYGAHGEFIRNQRCVVADRAYPMPRGTRCDGAVVPAHLVCRGMGGCNGDRFSLFPACEKHHAEQEGKTDEFQARYGLDLAILVEVYNLMDKGLLPEEREAAERRLAKLREPR